MQATIRRLNHKEDRDASSDKEVPIPSIHEPAATSNGAADAIAQMIARILPVGLDSPFANQRLSDLAVGCTSERPVEGPKNEGQSGAASFERKQAFGQFSIQTKGTEAFERPQAVLQKCWGPNSLHVQASWLKDISPGNCELDGVPCIA